MGVANAGGGTPNYADIGAYEYVSVHVSPSGDDTTGNGTSGTPYKTLNQGYHHVGLRRDHHRPGR